MNILTLPAFLDSLPLTTLVELCPISKLLNHLSLTYLQSRMRAVLNDVNVKIDTISDFVELIRTRKDFVTYGLEKFLGVDIAIFRASFKGEWNIAKYLLGELQCAKHVELMLFSATLGGQEKGVSKIQSAAKVSQQLIDLLQSLRELTNLEEHASLSIMYVVKNNFLPVVEYILRNLGPFNVSLYECLINVAAKEGHLEMVKYLTNLGRHGNVGTSIINAAERGYLDIVEYLIDDGKFKPLAITLGIYNADKNEHINIVEYLRSYIIDYN